MTKNSSIHTIDLMGKGDKQIIRSQSFMHLGGDILDITDSSLIEIGSWAKDEIQINLLAVDGFPISHLSLVQPRLDRLAATLSDWIDIKLEVGMVLVPDGQSYSDDFSSESLAPLNIRFVTSQGPEIDIEADMIDTVLHETFHLMYELSRPLYGSTLSDQVEEEALARAWAECLTRSITDLPITIIRNWALLPDDITNPSVTPEDDERKKLIIRRVAKKGGIGHGLAADAMWNIYLASGYNAQQKNRLEEIDRTCEGILDGSDIEDYLSETYRL